MVEYHSLSDYLRCQAPVPSLLCKGKVQRLESIFSCPSCNTEQKIPVHGKIGGCENYKCGLQWLVKGAAIKIWRN